jgi:signal transduction histidine kinase
MPLTQNNNSYSFDAAINSHKAQLALYAQHIREEERTRIAREIHDELGQWLTALKIEVHLIKKTIAVDDTETQQQLSSMIDLVMETEKAVERIATELRPCVLSNLGLVAALQWQVKEFEKRTGIQALILCSGDINPHVTLSTNIFRIYQEALTNIARHTCATKVETALEERDGFISLMIKDNGQGFDLNETRKENSFGLIGMKERAMMLHGDLHIESSKINGTTIRLKAPLDYERRQKDLPWIKH